MAGNCGIGTRKLPPVEWSPYHNCRGRDYEPKESTPISAIIAVGFSREHEYLTITWRFTIPNRAQRECREIKSTIAMHVYLHRPSHSPTCGVEKRAQSCSKPVRSKDESLRHRTIHVHVYRNVWKCDRHWDADRNSQGDVALNSVRNRNTSVSVILYFSILLHCIVQ
jgi:hypothetical protein